MRAMPRVSISWSARTIVTARSPILLPRLSPIGTARIASGIGDGIEHGEDGAVLRRIVNAEDFGAIHCRDEIGGDGADETPLDARAEQRAENGLSRNADEDRQAILTKLPRCRERGQVLLLCFAE